MRLNKKTIGLLVQNVLSPYLHKCESFNKNKSSILRHYTLLARVAANFFNTNREKRRKKFYELLKFCKDQNVEIEVQIVNIDYFLDHFATFAKKYQLESVENIERIVSEFKIDYFDIIAEFLSSKNTMAITKTTPTVEEPLDIIDTMHYTDEEKISAIEYISNNPLSDDEMEDIVLLQEFFLEFLDTFVDYSDAFLENYRELIEKTITKLEFILSSGEFKDISYSFKILLDKLENLQLEDDKKKMFVEYSLMLIEDIVKWLSTVFITQDTLDIHYLDAAFYSNIEQFDILFSHEEAQNSNDNDEEDDDFLF